MDGWMDGSVDGWIELYHGEKLFKLIYAGGEKGESALFPPILGESTNLVRISSG